MTNFDEEHNPSHHPHCCQYDRFQSTTTSDEGEDEEFDDDDDLSSSEISSSSLSDTLDASTGPPYSTLSLGSRQLKSNSLPKSSNSKFSVKWSPMFIRKRLNSKTFLFAPSQTNSLPRCPLPDDDQSSSLDRKKIHGSFSDLCSQTSRNGKSKSTGSAMLHKIAKKLGKLNLGSGNGDSTGGAERNGKDSTGSMKKKRRRSRSVSNLDSTLG